MAFEKTQQFFNEMSFFTLCNAAPELGKFFKETITISTPRTELTTFREMKNKTTDWVYTSIQFNNGQIGDTHLFFSKEDAMTMASYAIKKKLGEDRLVSEWDEFVTNTIEEIVNILGGNMTEILNVIYGEGVSIDVPELKTNEVGEISLYEDEERVVVNTFTVRLGADVKINMIEMAKQAYYENLITQLKKRV